MTRAVRSVATVMIACAVLISGCGEGAGRGGEDQIQDQIQDQAGVVVLNVYADPEVPDEVRQGYLELGHRAVEHVESLWGVGSVPQPFDLVVTATPERFAARAGVSGASVAVDVEEIPAVAMESLGRPTVVVHPHLWDRLEPVGRQAVISHEVTHLVMRRIEEADPATGTPAERATVPWWLSEGLAEYTAYRDVADPLDVLGESTISALRSAGAPTDWSELDIARDGDSRWERYATAWLVCSYLAERYSEADLLRVHHLLATAAGSVSPEQAMTEVFGESATQVMADWPVWWQQQLSASRSP